MLSVLIVTLVKFLLITCVSARTSYPWYYDIRGNEWQVTFRKFLLEMNLVRGRRKWVFQTLAIDRD